MVQKNFFGSMRMCAGLLTLAPCLFYACTPLPAYAQASAVQVPMVSLPVLTTLSGWPLVIAGLSLVAGFIAQAVNTGSILGLRTVPSTWYPVLTIVGSFLANFLQQVAGHAFSGTLVVNALLYSLFALIVPAAGVSLAHHVMTPKMSKGGAS